MVTRIQVIVSALLVLFVIAVFIWGRSYWVPVVRKVVGDRTTADVIEKYGAESRLRLGKYFGAAGIHYPPTSVTFLAVKDIAAMEVWAGHEDAPVFIHSYPILGLSGGPGPKLREGDRQVPEGMYGITGFNPNSSFHLSMKLNYPNAFDLTQANAEDRNEPGTNIFIHGKSSSVGCLAMGDSAIEELFVLVHDIGASNVEVVISPSDPRQVHLSPSPDLSWVGPLYATITDKFSRYLR